MAEQETLVFQETGHNCCQLPLTWLMVLSHWSSLVLLAWPFPGRLSVPRLADVMLLQLLKRGMRETFACCSSISSSTKGSSSNDSNITVSRTLEATSVATAAKIVSTTSTIVMTTIKSSSNCNYRIVSTASK